MYLRLTFFISSIFIVVFYFLGASKGFSYAWESRAEKLEKAICSSFVPESKMGDCNALKMVKKVSSDSLNTEYRLHKIDEMVKLIDGKERVKDACMSNDASGLLVSSFSFLPPKMDQNVTYDSIARVIEYCYGSEKSETESKNNSAPKLCAGTRNAASGDICKPSEDFIVQMQTFDRSGQGGFVPDLVLKIVSVVFGLVQLVCLLLGIFGFYRAVALKKVANTELSQTDVDEVLSVNEEDMDKNLLSTKTSATIAAAWSWKRATDQDRAKRMQIYFLYNDAYKQRFARSFESIGNLGDIIVLLGLMGTLWGMIVLFASLAESGSSVALSAEMAKSKMLGALGLAFGTTLFAGGVRMLYIHLIPRQQHLTEKVIDDVFIHYSTKVDVKNSYEDSVVSNSDSSKKTDLLRRGLLRLDEAKDRLNKNSDKNKWSWLPGINNRIKKKRYVNLIVLVFISLLIIFASYFMGDGVFFDRKEYCIYGEFSDFKVVKYILKCPSDFVLD